MMNDNPHTTSDRHQTKATEPTNEEQEKQKPVRNPQVILHNDMTPVSSKEPILCYQANIDISEYPASADEDINLLSNGYPQKTVGSAKTRCKKMPFNKHNNLNFDSLTTATAV